MKRLGIVAALLVFSLLASAQSERIPINAENLDQLTELASIGRGTITEMQWTPDGNELLIVDSAGFYFYDTSDFNAPPRFIEDTTGHLARHYHTLISPDARFVLGLYGLPRFSGGALRDWTALDMWDAETGNYYAQIDMPSIPPDSEGNPRYNNVERAVFSPDSRTLILSTLYGGMYRWDVESKSLATLVPILSDSSVRLDVQDVQFTSDGLWMLSYQQGSIFYIWDTQTWEVVSEISRPTLLPDYFADSFAISPDNTQVTSKSGIDDETILVSRWSLPDGELLAEYEVPTDTVIAFDPDNVPIAFIPAEPNPDGTQPRELRLTELESGLVRWSADEYSAVRVQFFPQTDRLLLESFGPQGRDFQVYDINDGTKLLSDYTTYAFLIRANPAADRLAVGGHISQDVSGWMIEETLLRVWDMTSGEMLVYNDAHAMELDRYAISSDGAEIGLAWSDARIALWDTDSWELDELPPLDGTYVVMPRLVTRHITFLNQNQNLHAQVYSSNGSRASVIWDVPTQSLAEDWNSLHPSPNGGEWYTATYQHALFSPDESLIAAIRPQINEPRTTTVTLQHADDRSEVGTWTLDGAVYWGNTIAFSPDSSLLAMASPLEGIYLWETRTFDEPRILNSRYDFENGSQPASIEISPDNRLIVVKMPDYFLFEEDRDPMEILDITTGDAWDKWDAGYRLRALEISPDGNVFLTVGRDDFILRFWDAQSGEELSAMGTLENVSDASFSPDGSLVLIETPPSSGGRDVVFWDVASGETVGVLQGHTQLYDPRFSDDMTLLTVQSTGRRLIVYGIQQQ